MRWIVCHRFAYPGDLQLHHPSSHKAPPVLEPGREGSDLHEAGFATASKLENGARWDEEGALKQGEAWAAGDDAHIEAEVWLQHAHGQGEGTEDASEVALAGHGHWIRLLNK